MNKEKFILGIASLVVTAAALVSFKNFTVNIYSRITGFMAKLPLDAAYYQRLVLL